MGKLNYRINRLLERRISQLRERCKDARIVVLHYFQLLLNGRRQTLFILPCQPLWMGGSSLLWGPLLGRELTKLGWNISIVPYDIPLHRRKFLARLLKPKAILMIKGRSLYNYPSYYQPIPTVFILDDADYVKEQLRDQVIECCKSSKAIVSGNETVKDWCQTFNSNVSVVWVPHPPRVHPVPIQNKDRKSIIAWAHSSPKNYPLEVEFIQVAISELSRLTPDFEFWFYGVNSDNDRNEFLSPLIKHNVKVKGIPFAHSYEQYLISLENVAIGLHPVCLENPFSHGKSFGKILSYIYSDVAVVTHDVLDHTKFFKHRVNGMLSDNPDGYAQCIYELLNNPMLRQSIVDQAKRDFDQQLTTSVAAKKLNLVLKTVIEESRVHTDAI